MALYFFKDNIDEEWSSFAFKDSKWRESNIKLNEKQREYVKKQRKATKFEHPVYVVNSYSSLSKFGELVYRY
jgi:hypothetical protein